jgi:hypothetical protein
MALHPFNNPWFTNLPFAPNKGEVLLVEANDMPTNHIFKKGINWVPWRDNIFWVGSSYEWDFASDQPTEAFRERTMATLQHWIKAPVRLLEHTAAVRPATIERRPFCGVPSRTCRHRHFQWNGLPKVALSRLSLHHNLYNIFSISHHCQPKPIYSDLNVYYPK